MKYSCFEIKPIAFPKKKGNIYYTLNSNDDLDRVRLKTHPNWMGFYHYPTFRGKEWAKAKLKERMIKDRKLMIKKFQREINNLEKL